MRTLVIGLDCAAPEILLGDARLSNIRALMARGCYGRLESVVPPITVPAWMCMASSQDPGSLGVYGFRNRTNYSYDGLGVVTSQSITAPAVWDSFGTNGKKVVIVGVPPGYPPRHVNGVSIGCFLTPDPSRSEFTHPAHVKQTIHDLVGDYPVDVAGFRTDDKAALRDRIWDMTKKHFQVIRHLMQTIEWDYFQFVEIGLDLKRRSPFPRTIVVGISNGYNGYLPTPEHHKLGGYETWLGTNRLEPQASDKMQAALLEMVKDLGASR